MEDLRANGRAGGRAGRRKGGREGRKGGRGQRGKKGGREGEKGDRSSKGQRARTGREGRANGAEGEGGRGEPGGRFARARGVGGKNLTARTRFEKCMGDDREPQARTARGQFYSLRCASELPTARGRGRRFNSVLVSRAYFRKRHPRPRPRPRPPVATASAAGQPEGDGSASRRCASSINSTDKQEKRTTTRYVIPADRTARRAKCKRRRASVACPA